MAEVAKRNRLPRRNPLTDCKVCGGDLEYVGRYKGKAYVTRYLKCSKCGAKAHERDEIEESY